MPLFKRATKRDHNDHAEAALTRIERGIHDLYTASDKAANKAEAHVVRADKLTAQAETQRARAASAMDDFHAHGSIADALMDAFPTPIEDF